MMNICMVVHKNFYIDQRVKRYAESLAKAGYPVDLLCLDQTYQQAVEVSENPRVHTIPVKHQRKGLLALIFEYAAAFLLFLIHSTRLYFKNRYQVLHIHNMPDVLVFTGLIPKLMGARIILDIHDPMPELYTSKIGKPRSGLVYKLICLEERISCQFADAVITVNERCKANLMERGIPASKITIVSNYPDLTRFDRKLHENQSANPKSFILIYAGTIQPRYGLDIAIKAMPELTKQIPGVRLVILGPSNTTTTELRQLAADLGVEGCVEFRALVPAREMPGQLASADVGIYTAYRDRHMEIATPTKVLEYAAMGLAVVSSRLSGVESIFGDDSVAFFEPENINQYVKCVLNIYRDPQYRQRLAENAYEVVRQKHSWANEFDTYLKMLGNLSQRSSGWKTADSLNNASSDRITDDY